MFPQSVLEIYITREVESSQAQTDLNLARFYIQAGIILLWCPVVHTVIIDIKAVPADDYIWASFLSRLKQRLFIKVDSSTTPTMRTPPLMPITAFSNVINGSGSEQSTTRNPTARWGDSQGVLHSHDRLSIPNLAIGMGYNASGAVPNGFLGTLDTMLSPHTPGRGSTSLTDYPFRIPLVHYFTTGELDFLTSLDIVIPRPSWGHEETEGLTLGLILRRLTGLRRLSVHADGVVQHNSGNYGEFGLMRKPPFSATDTGDDEDSDDADADMVIAEDGTVVYPSGSGAQAVPRTSSSQSGQISIPASTGSHKRGGYGPETWWAGLLNGLTISHLNSEAKKGPEAFLQQSIRELRISIAIPGGYIQLADFDAFFAMVVPYLQRMTTLETLVFDMLIDMQSEANSYYNWSRNGPRAMRDHYERQRAYVTRLIDPDATIIPLLAPSEKPEMMHHRSEPYYTRPTSTTPVQGHNAHTPARAGTADSAIMRVIPVSTPVSTLTGSLTLTQPSGERLLPSAAAQVYIPLAKTLRHVYFGEYHGIPALSPPDLGWGANQRRMGGSREGSPTPSADPGKLSHPSARRADRLEEIASAKKAAVMQGFTTDKGFTTKPVDKDSLAADDGVNVDNQRSVPGMWWSVIPDGQFSDDGEPAQLDGSSVLPQMEGRVVVQGWEEDDSWVYSSKQLTDVTTTPDQMPIVK